jgi:hypothetical protein
MNLYENWRTEIDHASSKELPSLVARIAEQYDESLLLKDVVPEDAFSFITYIFSEPKVLSSRGLERFLLDMNVDLFKYSKDMLDKFLATLMEQANNVVDPLALHSFGDFIARAYDPEVALDVHRRLIKGTERERKVGFVVIDLLRRRVKATDPIGAKVMQQWAITSG